MALIGRPSDLDLKLLRVFQAVVEAGGLSAAEVSLNMSVSNISTRIADLEKRLDMRLCERGPQGFRLTDQGRQVFSAIEQLEQHLEQFRNLVAEARHDITGELRLMLTDNTLSDPHFPIVSIIQRFQALAPRVHLILDEGTRTDVEQSVVSGEADLGITSLTAPLGNLACQRLYQEEYFLYCAPPHPLFVKEAEAIRETDVAACDFIDHAPGSHGSDPIVGRRQTATAASLESRAILILAGRHVGFLPSHYSQRWTCRGEMRALLPETMYYRKNLYALTKRGTGEKPSLTLFMTALGAAYPDGRNGLSGR